jgi:hypothetical protein
MQRHPRRPRLADYPQPAARCCGLCLSAAIRRSVSASMRASALLSLIPFLEAMSAVVMQLRYAVFMQYRVRLWEIQGNCLKR